MLAMLVLPACSNHWNASMRFVGNAEAASRGLKMSTTSALGDHFPAVLVGDCADVRIPQSPKLPNKIMITVTDANDQIIGSAITHDLARRSFVIPLTGVSATIEVTPGSTCK
ncbi:MAG: hypothetical protein H7315_06385 [Herminiimonas sp.]|nr:hypothetical protein [Herminiimonas sp.]